MRASRRFNTGGLDTEDLDVYYKNIHMKHPLDSSQNLEGFDWDTGNSRKNLEKHGLLTASCEEVFSNQPLIVEADISHSEAESRYRAMGKSTEGVELFVAFTIRGNKIRVISARPMSRQERRIYEKAKKIAEVQE